MTKKPPYNEYDKLPSEGIEVIWANPSDTSSYPQGDFDVIYDNNAKTLETNQALIDHYKVSATACLLLTATANECVYHQSCKHAVQGKISHFVFVGSAGAYKTPANEPLLVEGDPRKGGHLTVEKYLEEQVLHNYQCSWYCILKAAHFEPTFHNILSSAACQDLPYTVFQPLYIYGPDVNKDCDQWFLERLLRGRPVLLPGPGVLTSFSHIEDVASMMAKVCSLVPGATRCQHLSSAASVVAGFQDQGVFLIRHTCDARAFQMLKPYAESYLHPAPSSRGNRHQEEYRSHFLR